MFVRAAFHSLLNVTARTRATIHDFHWRMSSGACAVPDAHHRRFAPRTGRFSGLRTSRSRPFRYSAHAACVAGSRMFFARFNHSGWRMIWRAVRQRKRWNDDASSLRSSHGGPPQGASFARRQASVAPGIRQCGSHLSRRLLLCRRAATTLKGRCRWHQLDGELNLAGYRWFSPRSIEVPAGVLSGCSWLLNKL